MFPHTDLFVTGHQCIIIALHIWIKYTVFFFFYLYNDNLILLHAEYWCAQLASLSHTHKNTQICLGIAQPRIFTHLLCTWHTIVIYYEANPNIEQSILLNGWLTKSIFRTAAISFMTQLSVKVMMVKVKLRTKKEVLEVELM